MRLVALRGHIVTDYEVWPDGTVLLGDGSITEVRPDDSLVAEADEVHDHPESLILPGFVDLQVNGAFGVDVASESARLPELSEALLSTGTTSYLPTLISSPEGLYEEVLPAIGALTGSGAEVLGVHLEGPFISLEKRGAHAAAHVLMPDAALLAYLLDLGPVRMITLAPELEDADRLISLAVNRGVVVSAGHSDVAFEPAYDALDGQVAGVTHLFNGMSGMHHREPGLPGAAFAHPRAVCSMIADGLHVHPEMVGLAFRMLGPDRICLVTDAIAATGREHAYYERGVYEHPGLHRLHRPRGRAYDLHLSGEARRRRSPQGPPHSRLRRRRDGPDARPLRGGGMARWQAGLLLGGRMRRQFGAVTVECIQGDITSQDDVEAVVNAANARLEPGGGVAGAIHRASGPGLAEEAVPLGPIQPGEAVITGAHGLPNRYVVHTLGPVYGQDRPEAELLGGCYRNSLALAEEYSVVSIAFPAISTGVFGYPIEEAAGVALGTIREEANSLEHVRLVRFVLHSASDLQAHERVLSELE